MYRQQHEFISEFNPCVEVLKPKHKDYLLGFEAGENNWAFTDFAQNDALHYLAAGDGTTHLVFNKTECNCELVAYYTLAASSIPYIDRIRLDVEDQKQTGKEFDEQQCGISAIEIKMFAVADKYQDLFYKYDGIELPISAWVLRSIIDYIKELSDTVLGIKAIFLRSVPSAKSFYLKNEFNDIKKNMIPFHSVDSDLEPMYFHIKEIHMSYDE